MTTDVQVKVEERIIQVLQHLGIAKAHFAARGAGDWSGLVISHPEVISSLTLVCPQGFDPENLAAVAPKLLVINGDQGATAEMVERNLQGLPDATIIPLSGYATPNTYADIAAERKEDIGTTVLEFLERMDQTNESAPTPPSALSGHNEGEVANISYRVVGSGPPLVLLPLNAAPSQWGPILPRLGQAYSTVVLGGPELGMIASLEARGRSQGYLGALRSLMQAAQLRPGESVLEVGCGTGVLDRWLARRTQGRNRIVGVDISAFFLREAAALAKKEGLENVIEFQEANAEALPFPDGSFDVAMASTVIQRVNADRMMAEMVRITKPGGRVAVVGHAHDMPLWVNLPLGATLKSKVESPPWTNDSGHDLGCDDATLYRRFHDAGLSQITMFPYMGAFADGPRLESLQTTILPTLSPEEGEEWRVAVTQAQSDGTFFISTPFHCAVGRKP